MSGRSIGNSTAAILFSGRPQFGNRPLRPLPSMTRLCCAGALPKRLCAMVLGLICFGLAPRAAWSQMTIQALENDPGNANLLGHYDRFDITDRSNTGATFIGAAFNWSGVGQTVNGQWGTMISPSFFVSANHFHPGIGE